MSNLREDIRQAVTAVHVEWDSTRSLTTYGRVREALRRDRYVRATAMAGMIFGALVLGAAVAHVLDRPAVARAPASAADAPLLKLSDGSRVFSLAPRTVVETMEVTPSRISVKLTRGRAEFDIAPSRRRVFRVLAEDAVIEVMGTRFSVERLEHGARVAVSEGKVRVLWDDRERVLGPGQTAELSTVEAKQEPRVVAAPARPSAEAVVAPAPVKAEPSWREFAKDDNFQQAHEALVRAGTSDIKQDPDDLLLAADVLRLSNHAQQAVPLLRAVVSRFPRDPRAPLAAFTLGRVLLESLGQPRDAAVAFRQAQSLAPMGVLAEDALAREIEALSRAADTSQAQQRAEAYLKKYPSGSKVRAVRMYGGL